MHESVIISRVSMLREEGDGDWYDPMKKARLHAMDLISDLPEPSVHHIMSYLTTLDVTKLSILSRRFFFLWGSYPVIDLDQKRFARTYQGTSITNGFLDHIHNTLLLRRNAILYEFRVKANLKGILANPRFDSAILMALASEVKCMDLNLGFAEYLLPTEFASKMISVLTLKGLQLDLCNLIRVCPSIKTMCLTSCVILQDIKFSSKTLTEIELHCCGVKSIKINAPNLQLFLFKGKIDTPCQIDVSLCENIMYFSLNNLVNGRDWIEEHVCTLSKLKTFILNGCQDIERIKVCNDKLERIEIRHCHVLTSIELKSKSLESFVYERTLWGTLCSISFLTSSKYIKDLSMKGAVITDQWLEDQLAKMISLEKLRLEDCNSLKNIKLFHEKLEILELYSCHGLVEAEIDMPKLVSFEYHGKVIEVSKMVTRSNCTATLSMTPWTSYENESYCRWRNLLSFFNHFKALKLICNDKKEVMIPELHRERLVSPLYDLQHLEIQIKSLEKIGSDLVDSLLWLSPLPKTLHVSSGSCNRLQMIIKFAYSDMVEGEEDENPFCCATKPVKCWKHHLKRLEIQSSDVSPKNRSIEILKKYFLTNAKISADSLCFSLGLK